MFNNTQRPPIDTCRSVAYFVVVSTALRLDCPNGQDANTSAAFYFMALKKYTNFAEHHEELVGILSARGLSIPNKSRVARHLTHVSYTRLMGYAKYFMLPESQIFKRGTCYDDIWNLYKFDRELRLLTLDAIERIEVSGRSILSDVMSLRHGPHWFLNDAVYSSPESKLKFVDFISKEIGRKDRAKRHNSVNLYYSRYKSPELPPSWTIMEVISMGTWTRILSALSNVEQKIIAKEYDLPDSLLVSWLSSLSRTRNVCAHHNVLWNYISTRPARSPHASLFLGPDFSSSRDRFYATAIVSTILLKKILRRPSWPSKLKSLLSKYSINHREMGFPTSWTSDPFWQ